MTTLCEAPLRSPANAGIAPRASLGLDVFMCVHGRDIGTRLAASLDSYTLNFGPKGALHLVSNEPRKLESFVARSGLDLNPVISADEDWLRPRETALPGWFKQQLIKLRAYRFCRSDHFCNLGADTLLVRPIVSADLIGESGPVLYYSMPALPNHHTWFEARRLFHIARILRVWPLRSAPYVDFINDFFCFERARLEQLDDWVSGEYGPDGYADLLAGLDPVHQQTRFSEWALYSVFVLDRQRAPATLRNTRRGHLQQIHSPRMLRSAEFTAKVIHLVNRGMDDALIGRKLASVGSPLSRYFA
jgi:hypothetical protein